MEESSGVEDLEAWLCSLAPRAELVARMALHLRLHAQRREKSYFARVAALIRELDLKAEDLSTLRAEAQKVAASLDNINPGIPRKQPDTGEAFPPQKSLHRPRS